MILVAVELTKEEKEKLLANEDINVRRKIQLKKLIALYERRDYLSRISHEKITIVNSYRRAEISALTWSIDIITQLFDIDTTELDNRYRWFQVFMNDLLYINKENINKRQAVLS